MAGFAANAASAIEREKESVKVWLSLANDAFVAASNLTLITHTQHRGRVCAISPKIDSRQTKPSNYKAAAQTDTAAERTRWRFET